MKLANNWKDYEIIDCSNGEKLERWKDVYLLRPDPQIIWDNGNLLDRYKDLVNARYIRSDKGGGHWDNLKKTKASWKVSYDNLLFNIKQMGFKHTGLFPEQAYNWEFFIDKIKRTNRDIKVLNLFAYTGGATVACISAGAHVTHVDSSKGMVDWSKENVKDSLLDETKVRYIVDDVVKFVQREIRRGNKYDAIIMDPPSYGRGSNGEVWDIEKDLFYLVKICLEVLTDNPLFFQINSYTTGLSKEVLSNILKITVGERFEGVVTSEELGLPISNSELVLPCGIYGRYENNE